MRFIYPLGLLGLIGVPILIIIYIIKNKYTEQIIASTYIWNLSEKFLKRRLPIHRIIGLLSLILQIVAVTFISFAVAHPVFAIPGAADDYCFILDGSGSMNFMRGDKTRFDSAKDEIISLINGSAEGSSYSLILAGSDTNIIFKDVTDKEIALKMVDGVTSEYGAAGVADALGEAQTFFNDNPSSSIYLLTDKSFEETKNINVINFSDGEENYALADVTYSFPNANFKIEGSAVSYESDATLTVELYVNGGEEPYDHCKLDVEKNKATQFTFQTELTSFRYFKVAIAEQDDLAMDNEVMIYNLEFVNSNDILIVSEHPFFMHASLLSVLGRENAEMITDVSHDEYNKLEVVNGVNLGYKLYIFDNYAPSALPEDGAVWFVNPKDVAGSGFSVQDEVDFRETGAQRPAYSDGGTSVTDALLRDIDAAKVEDVYILKYKKCGTYRKFDTVMTLEGNPLIFAGTNEYGNREAVFAFDFTYSNFPILADFVVLTRNLLGYTFPPVIEGSSYVSGDTLEINVLANCESIRVESPLGNVSYQDTSQAICEYPLTEVGTYAVKVTIAGEEKTYNVFAALPKEERAPAPAEQSFIVAGEAGGDKRDGIFSDILYLFILLAVASIADWMVYCYEQYQLR